MLPQTQRSLQKILGSRQEIERWQHKLEKMAEWSNAKDPTQLASAVLERIGVRCEMEPAAQDKSIREEIVRAYQEVKQELLGQPERHQFLDDILMSSTSDMDGPTRDSTRRILEILGQVYGDPQAVRTWLRSPHPDLGHRTPREVILQGYPDAVEDMLEASLVGLPT